MVGQKVTVVYRGARWELGRGQGFYGIWAAGAPRSQPVEWWPETPAGWQGAWSRFCGIEAPGAISEVRKDSGLAGAARGRGIVAAVLLAIGVGCGVASLFPGYLGEPSLAQQPSQLVPHVIYLATWTASALLILRGGTWRRAGTLLAIGTTGVAFGFFFADVGTAIAGGASLVGAGLVLGFIGWAACAAGCAAAFGPRSDGRPGRPRAHQNVPMLTLMFATFAAIGTAITFAPAWDSFTLQTATGVTQSVTAGNAFANPGPVIAGDVAVMVVLAVLGVLAAAWRPARRGAALLAGATIPMVAQLISAVVQLGEGVSPQQFGISPAQAAQAGLTISSGVTPAFWLYCAFVVALAATCGWMLATGEMTPAGPAAGLAAAAAAGGQDQPAARDAASEAAGDAAGASAGSSAASSADASASAS